MSKLTITRLTAHDVRARTSLTLAGSDAAHADPDYSAAYVVLHTDGGHEGHGMTFTLGNGNDLCLAAAELLGRHVVGRDLDDITGDMAGFWRSITSDSQLRWLGPEKGVVHLATGAVVNAVWDLRAKRAGLPLWKLLASLSPEEIVDSIDFRYISDVLSPEEATDMLR